LYVTLARKFRTKEILNNKCCVMVGVA